ncbi:beta-aspartyl-peptidase [Campylobacter anatolicus]|nr:beta-aspartyl-peptidase [Campylobacter anatolicus]
MMKLLKNAKLYTPKFLGDGDVLVGGGKILAIGKRLDFNIQGLEIYDVRGAILTPGLIDNHVHVTGGGGEAGYHSRTPEITLSELTRYGITSVVGVLGTDGCTRSLENLYAKIKALEFEGISTYMHTANYRYPSITLTGSVINDLVLIDKVIGVKIAIADNRGSFVNADELIKLVSDIRIGGMISKKGGVLHMHMGALNVKFDDIFRCVKDYGFLVQYFEPTHCGRTKALFEEAVEFVKMGGFIDITTGGSKFAPIHEIIAHGLEHGLDISKVSLSSDGNGSVPKFNEKGELIGYGSASCASNLTVLKEIVKNGVLSVEQTLSLMSLNIAKFLNLNGKGEIKVGNDADFAVFDSEFNILSVMAKGEFMVRDGEVIKKGFFEA